MPRRISARAAGFGVWIAGVALAAVACGSTPAASGGSTTTAAPPPTTTAAAPTTTAAASTSSAASGSAVTIKTASGSAGIWLTDQTGRTLYIYTVDKGSTSACYGGCATAWPPFLSNGPVAVNGQFLDGSLVGSTKRTDGTTQVTYGGKPLYYFKSDTSPGETKGQGVGGVWYILGPKANIMK
ncbi:MAG TPA: hypothetical protein VF892_18385 [Pseudonocardiaceae bacterium]